MTDAPVIVVGGGPAGASTAWHLARSGVEVLVLDRARFPRGKPCAEYLSPEASRVLAAMGALAPCESAGAVALRGMVVRAPNGVWFQGDYAAAHGYRGFRDRGLALRREVLDAILLDRARAAGVRVEEGVRVVDVMRDGRGAIRGVVAVAADGRARERRARLVVGADGLRSTIARRVGLARRARWPRRTAFVAHYRGVAGMGRHGEMHVERDGYVGLAPLDDGLVNVALVVPQAGARRAAGAPAEFLDGWLRRHPHLAARFARAIRHSPVRVTGPFAYHAPRAWAPGVALVGDAADFYDPFTGEGIYAALAGGELAAPALLAALQAPNERAEHAALANYEHERRRTFSGKWKVERLITLTTASPLAMNYAARRLLRRKDLADLLVGVTGDFIPAHAVLSLRYVVDLLLPF